MESKLDYEELVRVANVLVRVPREGTNMVFKHAHKFEVNGKAVSVDSHFRNGMFIPGNGHGRGVILNRIFYGLNEDDLGKRIVADVSVVRKTTGRGYRFLMLDIIKSKSNESEPDRELKFLSPGSLSPGDDKSVMIPDTETWISFMPR